MQPYVNPNYFQQQQYGNYQPQFQPSYQRYMPQQTIQEQRPMMCGGLVDDFGLITANDVPMDGSPAVFVKKDGKEIEQGGISKAVGWTKGGNFAFYNFRK